MCVKYFFRIKTVLCVGLSAIILLLYHFKIASFKSSNHEIYKRKPVPNVIHFVNFVETTKSENSVNDLDFITATCMLAAYLNQNPEKIVYHTNVEVNTSNSQRWLKVAKVIDGLLIKVVSMPTHVFGQRLSSIQHASDVKRLQILLEEGGIYLDSDLFLISNLNEFFSFDVTLGWPDNESIGNQIIIARPRATFIQLWLESYRDYRPSMWYYNAGQYPTERILNKNPELVHRVKDSFGVTNLASKLYTENWSGWKNYHSVHLLARHRSYLTPDDVETSGIDVFDLENIQYYNNTFGEMARSVWNSEKVLSVLNS